MIIPYWCGAVHPKPGSCQMIRDLYSKHNLWRSLKKVFADQMPSQSPTQQNQSTIIINLYFPHIHLKMLETLNTALTWMKLTSSRSILSKCFCISRLLACILDRVLFRVKLTSLRIYRRTVMNQTHVSTIHHIHLHLCDAQNVAKQNKNLQAQINKNFTTKTENSQDEIKYETGWKRRVSCTLLVGNVGGIA